MHERLLSLARRSRLGLTLTILLSFLAGILTITQAWFLSQTVDSVFLGNQMLTQVSNLLRILLAVIVLRALLLWASEVTSNSVAVHIKNDLRQRLFAHIQALGPAYTRGQRTGELTAAAVEGIQALDSYFSQYLPQLVIAALVPLSILFFVFPIDPLSGIVLLLTAPLIPVFMVLIGRAAEALTRRQWETLSRLSAHFLDSLQGLTTLKLLGQSKAQAQTIAESSAHFRDATMNVLRVTFLSALVLELVATLSTAIVAVEVGLRLLYFQMSFQEAFFLLILAPEFYIPLRMLGLRFHAGMQGTSAARRIFEILDTPSPPLPLLEGKERRGEGMTNPSPLSISFRDVSFTYPDESTPALQNINLKIESGQHIALVGPSGAGKSTLVNLLLGFIQPTSGEITTSCNSPHTVHGPPPLESIAWVPQRPYLFHDTLAANIRLGKPEASKEEIIAAAQAAHLHEFIQSLPRGYDSLIGEGGARLSSGEAQRLALARAFLKDASLLILDEPTSSLDPENEALLEESTRRLTQPRTARGKQRRTVVTIAHRLNTVFQADQIVVLDRGRIVESGTHEQLLAQNGVYAKMVKAYSQFQVESSKLQVPQKYQPSPSSTFDLQPPPGNLQSVTADHPAILSRLLGFLKGSRIMMLLSVLLGTLTVGSNVALMGTSSWLIATAALHPSVAELEVAIVGVRFFGISRGVFRYLERLVSHNVTFRLLARLRVWFYQKLEPLAPARLMDFRSGDLLSRILADIETLENFYVRVVAPPLVAILVTLGTSFFLASYTPQLGLALLGFLLSLGLVLPLLTQSLSRRPTRQLIDRRADLHVHLVDGIQGLTDSLAYGYAGKQQALIQASGEASGRAQLHMAWIGGFQTGAASLLTNLGMWTVLVLAIPLVTTAQIPGVLLAMLALVTLTSFEAVTPLPEAAQMYASTSQAAQRLFEVVDTQPAVSDSNLVIRETPRAVSLTSENLTFAYPGQPTPALRGITFTLESGCSVAIVGPSGAGKSTLVNLLLRFWDYQQGEIYLNGQSLRTYAQGDVRRSMAVVSQGSYFFNATIRQNLRLANPDATDQEIIAAARRASIHNFIQGLSKGYDTFIGERGVRLSGGERQRLAIARALLKDAPLLVLDEPTANLDPLTERQVMETLFELLRNKTVLLITHRLVGLEHFDQVLVLDRGQIVERGRHAELLARGELYKRLLDLQNRILETRFSYNQIGTVA